MLTHENMLFCVMNSFWRLVLVAFVAAFTLPVGYQLNQAAICDAWAQAATMIEVIAAPYLFIAMTGHLRFLQKFATALMTASWTNLLFIQS